MHLLVDGDIVVFRFSSALESTTDWGNGLKTTERNLAKAQKELDLFIRRMMAKTFSTEVTMCFTAKNNFRYSVLPTYKYNRVKLSKPAMYNDLQDYVESTYTCKTKPGLEADDVLGIMCTLDPENTVIATIDKDLLQIPGHHYNWNWNRSFECFKEDCDRYFYQQCLSGDPGDGYKGIPGIGAVKAQKMLECYDDDGMWRGVATEYEMRGLTEVDALQQARVARICRYEDYNFDKQEVILWEPKY